MSNRLIRAFILLYSVAAAASAANTDVLRLDAPGAAQLPDLPGAQVRNEWGFNVAEADATLRYGSGSERWNAGIEYPHDLSPALRVSHAFRMTNDLVAGTKLRYGPGLSEMFVNAVYAYSRKVRFRLAAGERRSELDDAGGPPSAQRSYLVSARRISDGGFWTDATFTAYAGRARNIAAAASTLFGGEEIDAAPEPWDDEASVSESRGYALNLGFAPGASTKVDLRYMYTRSSHYFGNHLSFSEIDSAGKLRFTQALSNCTQVSGGVAEGTASRQLELQLRQSNLRINARKDLKGADETSFWIAYSATFDGPGGQESSCALRIDGEKFDPMLDVAMRRPAEYSYVPLAVTSAN